MAVTQDPHQAVQASILRKKFLQFENIGLMFSFFISVILVPPTQPEVSKQGIDLNFAS